MRGFYIYCVRYSADAGKIKARGIEFGSNPRPIPFKDSEAIVSEIDLSKFNAKTIKEKLQEDAKWTEKNVKRHHEVIAEANKTSAVIPMKFGTLYKTKKNLEAMLRKHYAKFTALLLRLKDKQEWGVKGYLEYKKFVEILKNKNKEIKNLEKKRSSVPEGMKWYVDRKSDELIAGQIERGVEEELQKIIKKLEKHAEEIRLNDLLPKEAGEPAKDMILNAACLVRNDALDNFKTLFQELAAECGADGIVLIMTGPWPPYNFVD
jgi:hypothetical protein